MIWQKGDVVSVWKDGVIKHVGIFAGDCGRGYAEVVHNTPRAGRVVRESFEAFADGKPVSLVKRAPSGSRCLYVERALAGVGRRYDLLTFNCEHFVTWVYEDRTESGQLRTSLAAVAVIAVGTFLATRPKYDENVRRYRRKGQFTTWW